MRLSLILLYVLVSSSTHGSGGRRPNIIFILSDDQGYGDISSHGAPDIRTPRLDAFADEGVRFDAFHSAPVCSPTRASLMTGKQFLAAGVWGVHGGRDYLDLSETTIAGVLSENGYATAMLGKWHLGKTAAYLPYNRGFDQSWSITDRLYMHTDPVIDHNGVELRPKGWTAEYLTDRAIEWMAEQRDKPFFLYLAHAYPHEPYYAPQSLIDEYKNGGLSESYARLCAMMAHLDSEVGRLLDAVDSLGLRDNTLVWFMGDNGPIGNPVNVPHLTDEEMERRKPQGFRGLKGNLYEGGHRVPSFVRLGNQFPVHRDLLEGDVTDIVPTLLEIAGIDNSALEPDGGSLLDRLYGGSYYQPRLRVYANHEAIWPGRERLYDFLGDKSSMVFEDQVLSARWGDFKWVQGYGRRELYDLSVDSREKENVISSHMEEASRLEAQLKSWWQERVFASSEGYGMPKFPLGESGGETVVLPAGAPVEVFGKVRQESHTSDEWNEVGDGLAWQIFAPKAGGYSVTGSVEGATAGAKLSLSDGNTVRTSSTLEGRVDFGEWEFASGEARLELKLTAKSADGGVQIRSVKSLSVSKL